MEDTAVFFGERFTVWQETSAFICSNLNMSDAVGNLSWLCGFHLSSQGWAWDQDCLDIGSTRGSICQNMDITSDIVWENPSYLKQTISNLSGSLFLSLSFVFDVFSPSSHFCSGFQWWVHTFQPSFYTTFSLWSKNGSLWRRILPKHIKISQKQECKHTDSHPLTLTTF